MKHDELDVGSRVYGMWRDDRYPEPPILGTVVSQSKHVYGYVDILDGDGCIHRFDYSSHFGLTFDDVMSLARSIPLDKIDRANNHLSKLTNIKEDDTR